MENSCLMVKSRKRGKTGWRQMFITYLLATGYGLVNCFALEGQEIDSAWILANRFPAFSRDTGMLLPDLVLLDEKGKVQKLENYRGKVVYIDVWTPSCAPCISQFAYARQLEKRMATAGIDKEVLMVNICMESSKAGWKKVLRKYRPPGINLFCPDTILSTLWQVNAVPRHLLLDGKGKVMCFDYAGPDDSIIDYSLYAATKGIKPAQSVWAEFRQMRHFNSQRQYTGDAEGKDYAQWMETMRSDLVAYFFWRQAKQARKP